jgi:hypothetical protein
MRLPRFRLRTLMIAIAVLAPIFAVASVLVAIGSALDDFYGPRGKLGLEQQIAIEIAAGTYDLQESRYVSAENRYRSALSLNNELRALSTRHGWETMHSYGELLIGLADALAGQHRYSEAVPLYDKILALIGPEHPASARVKSLLTQAKPKRDDEHGKREMIVIPHVYPRPD